MDGGAGTDTLIGGAGNDTYWLSRGSANDTIVENDAIKTNVDTAYFSANISTNQLWFSRSSNNLIVEIIGTNDQFTILDWYQGDRYHVEKFQTSDGKILTDIQVQTLVTAMAPFAPPQLGQVDLVGVYAPLAATIAGVWH